MDYSELKTKSPKELTELLLVKRNELRELRHRVSEQQLKSVRLIRQVRKTIARILTILNQTKTV